MPWMDPDQTDLMLRSKYTHEERSQINSLFGFHCFLNGSLPIAKANFASRFEDAILISDYGQNILSELTITSYSTRDVALACALVFFHHDFLVDIRNSDPLRAVRMLGDELRSGTLRLPDRFGRKLYDKFNDAHDTNRSEHLEAKDVDILLCGMEQGIYQLGRFVSGPLGIVESQEKRFVPPVIDVPLWHCSDTGCQHIHHVELFRHPTAAFELASEIYKRARKIEGPPSEWQRRMRRIGDPSEFYPRKYYDVVVLIADALSASEQSKLLVRALKGPDGDSLRELLKVSGQVEKGNPETIASKITEGSTLQLLMTFEDSSLVKMIDDAIYAREIKIPPTETRTAKYTPPTKSNYENSSTLSNFGIRSDQATPILLLSASIWEEYERAGQLGELAWRCQMGTAMPRPGEPMDYIKTHSVHEAIRNLVLPSRPITLAIAKKLGLELRTAEPDDELIDRFLWKLGFNFARYDTKYKRLRLQLKQLREQALNSPARLSADDRDAIRSRGVNVFVALENFIEELVSYNVWLLSSDHFGSTRFRYSFEAAVECVGKVLGHNKQTEGTTFVWSEGGGNSLGTLMVYARLAADWALRLPIANEKPAQRTSEDLPHYVKDPVRRFPFIHRELWADAEPGELKTYADELNAVIQQLERSRLAEIRNGLDHFREEDRFPSVDAILSCEGRLTAALDAADLKRLIPKAFWMTAGNQNQFGVAEYTLSDYEGRKLVLNGPSILSGLQQPGFSRPVIVPFGNLLGHVSSELTLRLTEESAFTKMWANYPRRSLQAHVAGTTELSEGSIEQDDTGV